MNEKKSLAHKTVKMSEIYAIKSDLQTSTPVKCLMELCRSSFLSMKVLAVAKHH